MTPEQFIAKWKAVELKERSAAQSHFIDLCHMLGEPTPTDADQTGKWYTFERGATKTTGGEGWADVWKRGFFGWEYKGKRKDLNAAFAQLQQYALALENPPLLVVCDMDRLRIHTNWTNSVSEVTEFDLESLRDSTIRQKLKWVFSDPERLRPGKTREALTEEAAAEFATLAQRLRDRGNNSQSVAHFINRLVFCMFAEDVDLLPNRMFKRMLEHAKADPEEFKILARDLFETMKAGGRIGFEKVEWFNGGLFDDDTALALDKEDIALALRAANLDWAEIDPSILGTLFERGLDPDKRSQLGAHYTDREKIMLIVEPTIIQPWLREWDRVKGEISDILGKYQDAKPSAAKTNAAGKARALYRDFLNRLRTFRVLDPACGSGNFLYLALRALKDLEHRTGIEAETLGLQREFPQIGPESVHGIEINAYAAELARVTVWIGEIQWMRRNGFDVSRNPILKPLETIQCRDAILNADGSEPTWPQTDTIIGNPPFLGDRKIVPRLGAPYATSLRSLYEGRVPGGADLVCYWFEKARDLVTQGKVKRAGLVATNSIRGGLNRVVLEKISEELEIFDAWEDEPWVIDGAAVRVSIVCFSPADPDRPVRLDGHVVASINPDLTSSATDLTKARTLTENLGVAFQGTISYGPFEISGDEARAVLALPSNPNGRNNSDVIRPWTNGADITKRPQEFWIVFFRDSLTVEQAALYEAPFKLVSDRVKPYRAKRDNAELNKHWWRLWRSRPELFGALQGKSRQIVTPRVSKYRLFVWRPIEVVPDSATVAIARDDDTTFGVLHSRYHEAWALRLGTSLEDRPRYTPGTTFETYPFPEGMTPSIDPAEYDNDARAKRISDAARALNAAREVWLNPPELVHHLAEVIDGLPDRLAPIDENAAKLLKKRTLTNLYNERPAWLEDLHRELDAAVAAAYGWPADIAEDDFLARLFDLNQSRPAA